MKQMLKKILPKPVIQQAVILRDQLKLNMTPQQNFAEGALKSAISPEALADIFNNPAREESWNVALEQITGVYGKNTAMGGVNPGDRRALYYLVHALRPQSLLEVGTHIGASTVFLAEALKSVSPQARMTTVDILDVNDPAGPWYAQGLMMSPQDYLGKLQSTDRVTFRVSSSSTYLAETQDKFDFIFLDGDHSSRTVYEEVSMALKILNQNGVILLHDYYPAGRALFNDGNIIAGPFMALDRIMRENKEIKVMPLGDLPWPTKQGLHKTSLALITRTS
jgi:predicted O-methyltransferase YrrM